MNRSKIWGIDFSGFKNLKKSKRFTSILLLLFIGLLFQSCSGSGDEIGSATPLPTATNRILPTLPPITVAPLQPTFTPSDPLQQSAPTLQPQSSDQQNVTPTPSVDLNAAVLGLTYKIPAIGLERTLEANLAGKLTLTDLANGNVVTVSNGQRFLTEIVAAIQANKDLFEPVPADCELCVTIGYNLPASGDSAEGALPDPTLQASIQRFFASRLGPHFPPNTVIGHHRTASGYTVAQTAAVTADNQLYRWIAADPQVTVSSPPALPDQATLDAWTAEIVKFNGVDLVTNCPNFPNETIVYQDLPLNLRCPELALANSLIEPYQTAAELTTPLLADERNLDIPSTKLPFGAVLYYEQRDGSTLTIFEDGAVTATFPLTPTEPITGTEAITPTVLPPETVNTIVPPREIEPLITPLLASDVIPRGVTAAVSNEQTEFEELILIRGADGVYEFAWSDGIGQELLPGIQILDLLLDEIRP